MSDILRDSFVGQLLRLVTKNRILQYPDEKDPSVYDRYINVEKSARLARTGSTVLSPEETEKKQQEVPQPVTQRRASQDSEKRRLGEGNALGRSGSDSGLSSDTQVDPEKDTVDQSLPQRTVPGSGNSSDTESDPNALVNTVSGTKVDPERGRDIHLVDWYGPEDAENPRNWSMLKKFWVTFEICFLTFSVYIGSSIYTAGIVDVTLVFGVSRVAATLGLTLFVIGYALGPMLWSPMSEMPFIGRTPIYIITLAVFVVLQVPTALATNFGMLMAFRFLTGFVGSPSLATGGASIADMYSPAKRTYGIAVWGVGAVMGPTMGPLVGGFAAESKGWTWTIWELMWLSGFTLVILLFLLPETSSANILYRRTQRLRKLTGNDKLKCEPELMSENMTGKEVVLMVFVRPFTMSFMEPICFALNMYIALIYGLLYIWFESFPIVFIEIYGFTLGTQGLAFIGILIGVLICIPPFFWYFHKYTEPKFNDKGEIQPEWRLPPAFVGAFCIPICLFWFGWSAGRTHWIVPIIGTAWFSIGAFLMFNCVLNYLGDAYPERAASVFAGNDLFRSSFGAAFPLFATAMYKNLGVGWASSLLGFLSIAFIPIPFLLFKYGSALRKRSKTARQDF